MKQLLTSAAMAMVLGTGAFAQTTETTTGTETQAATEGQAQSGTIMADDLIGMQLYSTAGAEMAPVEGVVDPEEQGWQAIGEINDLVLTQDGNVSAVVVGVGGFLGIGDKNVALSLDQVNVYPNADQDPVLVVTMTQEELEAAPAFEQGEQTTMTGAATTGTQAEAEGEAEAEAEPEVMEEESTTAAADAGTEPAAESAPQAEGESQAAGGTTTETIQIQTPEEDAQTGEAAQLETETEVEGAAASGEAETAATEAEAEMVEVEAEAEMAATEAEEGAERLLEEAETAEVTEESQEATQAAQEDLTEDTDTLVESEAGGQMLTEETEAEAEPAAGEAEAETMAVETETEPAAEAEAEAEPAAEAEAEPMTETEAAAEPEMETETITADVVEPEEAEAGAVGEMDRPMVQREGYLERQVTELTVDDLTGANVYGVGDEDIGTVGDLIVSADGTVTDAIINFGGFLGLGETSVAVSFDELQILSNEAGTDIRIYMDATQEELEAMPEYQR